MCKTEQRESHLKWSQEVRRGSPQALPFQASDRPQQEALIIGPHRKNAPCPASSPAKGKHHTILNSY